MRYEGRRVCKRAGMEARRGGHCIGQPRALVDVCAIPYMLSNGAISTDASLSGRAVNPSDAAGWGRGGAFASLE